MQLTITPKKIIVTLVIIFVIFSPLIIEWAVKYPGISKAENVARAAAMNQQIEIDCPYFIEALSVTSSNGGYVYWDDMNTIHLSYSNCNSLIGLWNKDSGLSAEQWVVLHTLAHEIEHTNGVSNEASAECYAMQRVRDVAIQWGLPEDEIEAHVASYYVNYYPRLVDNSYRSSECVDGGSLDLNINPPAFP